MPSPMSRAFRFGLMAEQMSTVGALVDSARTSEDSGFATWLIRDHFLAEPHGPQLGPIAVLAMIAGLTERLRLGTLVFANDYRHPVLLAQEVATLDVISGGRVELGIGTGFSLPAYEAAGLAYDPPGTRIDRLGEALQVLRGCFGPAAFHFAGEHYTVRGLDGFPKPVQPGGPPILIGAGGPRLLQLAARQADSISLQLVTVVNGRNVVDPTPALPETVAARVALIREAAGARFAQLELGAFMTPVVTEDREQAALELARARGWTGLSASRVLDMPTVFIGPPGAIVDLLHERRERFGLTYWIVRSADAATVAPLIARAA